MEDRGAIEATQRTQVGHPAAIEVIEVIEVTGRSYRPPAPPAGPPHDRTAPQERANNTVPQHPSAAPRHRTTELPTPRPGKSMDM
ncbi:hypothetical protein [Streptomyces uncialis]|uniref:hypothetical protein n=1 Tax=Streptomyces uncialis TaxID=1048205 RepID=UPI002255A2BF|nr:hypothetical protein [Streptomyces uncialis]MCX4660791.1 hypothetical protein [Streptomyces uncialis]